MRLLTAIALALVMASAYAVPARSGSLTVSAAASLTDAFEEICAGFGAVSLNTGSSGALLRQMEMGAPVDVFACADEYTMGLAVNMGLVDPDSIVSFASNTLVVVVPKGQDQRPGSPEELAGPGVRLIAVGNPASVPAGRYARAALERLGVWDKVSDRLIFAEDVRQALDYVRRGEVDAAVVYGSDAVRAGGGVEVAMELEPVVPITYPVAIARDAADMAAAKEFVGYLGSEVARKALARNGFGLPERTR